MGEREIKDLSPGQTAWTVPWALHEIKGQSFLHPNYSAYNHSGGTVRMRVGNGHDGKHYAIVSGKRRAVELAPFAAPNSDTIDHETWIEYHDRLVKEYYDFAAEWALIKEICPELEKTAPVMKQPLPKHVRQARAWAIGFAIWAVVSFIALDWTSTAVVATVWALVFATMYRYRSTRPPCASRPRAAAPRRPGGTP